MDKQCCRLCREQRQIQCIDGADNRTYFLCEHCFLIYVHSDHFLTIEEERRRYETHNNSIKNKGYVAFLNRIIQPMLHYIRPGMHAIDYGCGPGPTLSKLLGRKGITCTDYDPIFYPAQIPADYDFIFSTETFEYFFSPRDEIIKLSMMLKPGGYLGLMTECWKSTEQIATWYYTRDPAHVSFYHQCTLQYISDIFVFRIIHTDDQRVFILQKK
jgi:hypothetical protein